MTDQGLYRREMQVIRHSLCLCYLQSPVPSPQPLVFSPLISITSVCGVVLVPQVLDTCVGFGIPVAGLVGGGYSKDTQVGRVDSGRWDVTSLPPVVRCGNPILECGKGLVGVQELAARHCVLHEAASEVWSGHGL